MKRIKEIIGVLLLVTGIACTEDKGNYNYTPLNELTINGINKTYVAEIDSVLSISVNIIGEKVSGKTITNICGMPGGPVMQKLRIRFR